MSRKPLLHIFVLLFVLSWSKVASGRESFWPQHLKDALQATMRMEDEKAARLMKQDGMQHKEIQAYINAHRYFIKGFLVDRSEVAHLYLDSLELSFGHCSKLDSDDPWRELMMGEVQLMSGIIRGRYGAYLKGGFSTLKAFRKLQRNNRRFPDFAPSKLGRGLVLVATAQMTGQYKLFTDFFGLEGDYDKGEKLLSSFLEETNGQEWSFLHYKAAFTFAYAHNEIGGAKLIDLDEYSTRRVECLFLNYAQSLYYTKVQRTDLALGALSAIDNKYRKSFCLIDYMEGKLRAYQLDNQARIYFQNFLNNTRGETFTWSARRYLAHEALLRDDEPTFQWHRRKLMDNPAEKAPSQTDKLALWELGYSYHKDLIRARLRMDGGYHDSAMTYLKGMNAQHLNATEQMEYEYRCGKLLMYDKQPDAALIYFEKVCQRPFEKRVHWQAYSEYYMMKMYREKGLEQEAKNHYRAAKKYSGYPFESDLQMLLGSEK